MTNLQKKSLLKNIKQKCKRISEVLDICYREELLSLEVHYPLYKEFEDMLFLYGEIIQSMEREDNHLSHDFSFDTNSFSDKEIQVLNQYINQYCSGTQNEPYSFEKFNGGYKAVLPYLLSRRAEKGKYSIVKKKYVINVFRSLLNKHIGTINRMSDVTIIIVSCAPYGEQFVRDNDNSDSRDIINTIKEYILTGDDSGDHVNIIYDSMESDSYKTIIYILPKINFNSFLH